LAKWHQNTAGYAGGVRIVQSVADLALVANIAGSAGLAAGYGDRATAALVRAEVQSTHVAATKAGCCITSVAPCQ